MDQLQSTHPNSRPIFHLIILENTKTLKESLEYIQKQNCYVLKNKYKIIDDERYLDMRSTVENKIDMLISKTFKIFDKAASTIIRVVTVDVLNLHMWIPAHSPKSNKIYVHKVRRLKIVISNRNRQ